MVYCHEHNTKLNFCEKASSDVCGICLIGDDATRAEGVDNVLATPSGAPSACKGRVQALQLLSWLVLAGWTGSSAEGGLAALGVQVCRVKGGVAAALLWVKGTFLWSVMGANENVVKPLTECLFAPSTAPAKNPAIPSSYVAFLTRTPLMGESVLLPQCCRNDH